jgi:Na+/glutamate symporter
MSALLLFDNFAKIIIRNFCNMKKIASLFVGALSFVGGFGIGACVGGVASACLALFLPASLVVVATTSVIASCGLLAGVFFGCWNFKSSFDVMEREERNFQEFERQEFQTGMGQNTRGMGQNTRLSPTYGSLRALDDTPEIKFSNHQHLRMKTFKTIKGSELEF